MKPHYETLGVEEDASQEEIKKAYQNLSKANHPDKETDPEKVKEATDKQATINVAYSVLGNIKKRKIYDETGLDYSGKSIEEQAEGILYAIMREVMKMRGEEELFRAFHETMAGTIEQLESEKHRIVKLNKSFRDDIKHLVSIKMKKGGPKTTTFNKLIDDQISGIKNKISETMVIAINQQILASKKAYDILVRDYPKESVSENRGSGKWWTDNQIFDRNQSFTFTNLKRGGPFEY